MQRTFTELIFRNATAGQTHLFRANAQLYIIILLSCPSDIPLCNSHITACRREFILLDVTDVQYWASKLRQNQCQCCRWAGARRYQMCHSSCHHRCGIPADPIITPPLPYIFAAVYVLQRPQHRLMAILHDHMTPISCYDHTSWLAGATSAFFGW